MSEYWKSTGKWYCDICKCYTADNKASINFHERGKNHQENKRRRLIEIKKNAMDKRKKDEKDDKMFEKMEKAALAAVQKDMEGNKVSLGRSDMKNIVSANASDSNSSSSSDTYPWTAMLAPQGFTYYYNAQTGKSTWEIPEVFKKIEEKKQKDKSEDHARKPEVHVKISEDHVRKYQSKTKVKDYSSTKEEEEEEEEEKLVEEQRDVHPLLGGWSTVKTISVKKPEDEDDEETSAHKEAIKASTNEEVKPTEGEAPRESGKKFKEKVLKMNLVPSSSSNEPVTFKKRKSGSRNVRKRNDDD